MSEGYIYIGEYYHKHGKELNLTEKKIGLTKSLEEREKALNSTKFTIGYCMSEAYKVDDMFKVEKAIHSLLDHNRLEGEWFEDDDDSLKQRVNKFMTTMGYEKVNLNNDDSDVEEKQIRTKLDKSYRDINKLIGETFSYKRNGVIFNIKVEQNDKITVVETGNHYTSLNKACMAGISEVCYKGVEMGTFTNATNIWTSLKNKNGKSPDDLCKIKS